MVIYMGDVPIQTAPSRLDSEYIFGLRVHCGVYSPTRQALLWFYFYHIKMPGFGRSARLPGESARPSACSFGRQPSFARNRLTQTVHYARRIPQAEHTDCA